MPLKVLQNNEIKNIETIRTQNGGYVTEIYAKTGDTYEKVFTGTREISAAPPLTFKANGAALKDYRIYGNNGGVGDLATDTADEHYGKYKISVTVKGKNLLPENAMVDDVTVVRGVNFTKNADGSITLNGKCTSSYFYNIFLDYDNPLILNEDAIFSTGLRLKLSRLIVSFRKQSDGKYIDFANNSAFVLPAGAYTRCHIYIYTDSIFDNETIYPMIRKADIEDDTYEPYHIPLTTNIYLPEPLAEGESISMSDTGIAIPTIDGTNILTVDTQVQPSRVDVKGKIKKTL